MEMIVAGSVLAFLLVLDIMNGSFKHPRAKSMAELGGNIGSILVAFTIRWLPMSVIGWMLHACWPQGRGILAGTAPWLVFLVAWLAEDYANYWLHRKAHDVPWLWRLHKPHHTPVHMNVTASVREHSLYYLLVPVNLTAPFLIYTGAQSAAAAAVGLKLIVVYLQHTGYRWDLALRRHAAGRLLLDAAESVFSLQDFHHAHHGIGRFGNASSNYGNTLNVWDKLHGTSSGHPHCAQDAYGLPAGVKVEPWAEQLFWPLVRSEQPVRRETISASTQAELASARAIITLADGTRVAVRS